MFCKLGRNGGAGRGSSKRSLSTPAQLHRPNETCGTRPSIDASRPVRARPGAPSMAVGLPGREETFSLEPGELDFGAIIRLTPDIVKEIKRLEAQGGAAKIKFDENSNNSAGNVVEVGDKEFRFTWSRELTDLCDIYEERQNGDDGDGLLVECGSAWRKLNVQRILDESTKNHVKMRSEEAERMLKSRKAIVLDPTNPSVKNQAKSMAAAAVEGNMRRMGWKHKKEMLSKKRKVEGNQGAVALFQPKLVSKSATTSNGNYKGIQSPVPSPLQPRALLLNCGTGKAPRDDTNHEAITPMLNTTKEEIDIVVKEMPTGVSGDSTQEINGYEEGNIDHPIDLQSMLIALLSQNTKGMSLKALEQAVGEMIPNSVKKMENVLKNIATLQTSGNYLLKQGQIENSTRSSEGGSSPECSNKQTKGTATVLFDKNVTERLDQGTQSSKNELYNAIERIDIMQDSEDPLNMEKKSRYTTMVKAGTSSESRSDSDSGSASESGSQSRSKAGSGSASSSDSESDGTSSSKEASDVDVDIMTSDDHKGVAVQGIDTMASKLSPCHMLWRSNGEHDIVDIIERGQNACSTSNLDSSDFENLYEGVNPISDTRNLPTGRSAKIFELEAKTDQNIESQSKTRSSVVYPDHNTENHHESHSGIFNDKYKLTEKRSVKEQTLMKAAEQLDNHENVTKINTRWASNSEYLQEKSQNAKRMKASSSTKAAFGKSKGARSSEDSYSLSPERSMQMDQKKMLNNTYQQDERREINVLNENLPEHAGSTAAGNTSRVQSNPEFRGRPNFSAEQSSRKLVDSSGRKRSSDMEKPTKYVESNGDANKHVLTVRALPDSDISALKNMHDDKIPTMKGKQDENGDTKSKYRSKNSKEIIKGEKILSAPDLVNMKYTDDCMNGKGSVLRRELSDLELGEFRQSITDAMREDKRPFETKNSFKKIENKVTLPDSKVVINTNKCDGIGAAETKKQSPNILRGEKGRMMSADDNPDLSRSETCIRMDSSTESYGKNGKRIDQIMGAENEASGLKKTVSTRAQKVDNGCGVLVGQKKVKESKYDKLNGLKRSTEQDTVGLRTSNSTKRKKSMDFSSDEENAHYMQYRKSELDLRIPIKDFSMYKDFVREYQEKYSHYCSLNEKLEKIRNDFVEVGDDLELARGRGLEEYYDIVEKLRQMYSQHGEKHKEMKRVYVSLHEELKILKQRIKDFAAMHSGE